jgi:Helicase conserved C-terminal domain
MTDFLAGRMATLRALEEELVGPCPRGSEIDCDADIAFPDREASYGPWRQQGSGEEILQRDRPIKRYGIGVLYPPQIAAEADPAEDESSPDSTEVPEPPAGESPEADQLLASTAAKSIERIAERQRVATEGEESDFDLTTANAYRPSAMALSFVCELPPDSKLAVTFTGGRYRQKKVRIHRGASEASTGHSDPGDHAEERVWWLRSPVRVDAEFASEALIGPADRLVHPTASRLEHLDGLDLSVAAYTRPRPDRSSLVTVSVVNRSNAAGPVDLNCIFQCRFTAKVEAPGGAAGILPYEERGLRGADEEEESLALLYRASRTFAVGHGCAADWSPTATAEAATEVQAECLPSYEAPSITPDIVDENGHALVVPMAPLAGLVEGDDGVGNMEQLIRLYAAWVEAQELRVPGLDPEFQPAAYRHVEQCRHVLRRMRHGLDFLSSDADAQRAFRLANHAMLLQQLRTRRREPRRTQYNGDTQRIEVIDPLEVPDWSDVDDRGSWRPFQIAFVLTALESTARKKSGERETVELIFFPTGGGKTEAYLCLSAFSMFYRRLQNPADAGVDVLMRYTLRLLTAQQFQRAGALICAMEHLRSAEHDLGDARFSIGIWVGGSVTPNDRADARRARRRLEAGESGAENKFIVLRCPWCAAQMGEIESTGRTRRNSPKAAGYVERDRTVVLCCPDQTCEFSQELPILVVDEDIYEKQPSLVIGTVDKFAMLAWRPEARSIFGLDANGGRAFSPPNLIIQDELHLISGPLGSILGLYEAVIEELCTDHRGPVARPKIISSTATIRRSEQQIKDLYARTHAVLFPPRGLDASDSFFARYARSPNGKLSPGRLYVGIHGAGLGSVQTAQVRSFASLLQAPMPLDPQKRDPWWTLVVFFNSLRELGTSLSLLQSDIPDYLKVLRNRLGLAPEQIRRLWNILELTGRLRNDEVPRAMDSLEIPTTGSGRPVDICLASNIVEVGVDIDRLSLICVVGQPKTTSQYIQVTGRIGRRWWERPGLVATIYSPSKPRDRSHFEKFRSYHERLYAQVEPTSVTPFSPPVLDRALHAVLIAYVRQFGNKDILPRPVPEELIEKAGELLEARVSVIDPAERESLEAVFAKRYDQWKRWERIHWTSHGAEGDIPLMRAAGAYASSTAARLSWPVPTSLRNVDAECRAEITAHYILEETDV